MSQPINRFKADLRDFSFLVFEQFKMGEHFGSGIFADWDQTTCTELMKEVYRFAQEVTGPLNAVGDKQGCRFEDGKVFVPSGFHDAWKRLYEAGYRALGAPVEIGGLGSPSMVALYAEELISGSNTAFNMYPGLALGACEVIWHFGTDEQKKTYPEKMLNGTWGGTMCLTEPHAGTDVGDSTTTATPIGDGKYKIKGTKIYISGGDHDMADNIIHLVLARVDGAVAGTKGLSLFVVPKNNIETGESNDVAVASIEHKMGIKGSSTCVMNFGDDGECVGELVGTVEHQGMRQMFKMMNFARIGVGIQGLAVASTAYFNALDYARDRKQGSAIEDFGNPEAPRTPIINHPNIKRDLLTMKAKVEGLRALITKLAMHQDMTKINADDEDSVAYHEGQINLLTPLVKAHASDEAFRVCETAIQVYGGAGYLHDWPVEQYARDSKIFSIYEGTNAIQSLDLVGRKLGQNGGKNAMAFLGEVKKFIDENAEKADFKDAVANLKKAQEAVQGSIMQYMAWRGQKAFANIPLTSETFLNMMSRLSLGWLLLEQAVLADSKLEGASGDDKSFYLGKKLSGVHYALTILPSIVSDAKVLQAADQSPLQMDDRAFGPDFAM